MGEMESGFVNAREIGHHSAASIRQLRYRSSVRPYYPDRFS